MRDGKRATKTRRARDDLGARRHLAGAHDRRARSASCASRSSPRARTARSTPRCARLQKGGAKGVVFDLRGNGGGLVTEAQLVASAFLRTARSSRPRGARCRDRRSARSATRSRPRRPLVVLVDRDSASASEIVAGALQDRKRGDARRHAHVRQGRLPGGARAVQRRRAGHHRRPVLPAQRAATSAARASRRAAA